MKIVTALVAAVAISLTAPAAMAAQKGNGSSSTNLGGSNAQGRPYTAPGQQMINKRTSVTAPGNSYNAPGQRMIRQRTPGGTPTK